MKTGHIVLTLALIRGRCESEGECLLWQQAVNTNGLPYAQHRGKVVNVRRLAWELANGEPLPRELVLGMSCGHSACLNLAHMQPMQRRQLQRKLAKAGKFSSPAARAARTAAARQRAVLSMDAAREIRSSTERSADLAARFGVSLSTVQKVRQGIVWAESAVRQSSVFALASGARAHLRGGE